MSEEQKFCTACGCNVSPGMQFCPQCGRAIEGSEAFATMQANQQDFRAALKESRRNYLAFAIAIYAIPAIVLGILALLDASNSANVIFNNSDFHQYYVKHGWTFSENDLKGYIMAVACMELLSGACAAGSVYFIQKRQKRKVAVVLCVIAAFLCIWSFLGMFLGLLMAWSIAEAKDLFEDERAE